MPEVSVIIATYNVENYIERAIKSVLAQEGVTLEVVVVDDASSDATWAVAGNIKDERIKCLKLQQNGGPSTARNKAIAAAKGQWIAILDGDDAFEPGRLARCLELAKTRKADIVVDNLQVFREEDSTTFPMFSAGEFSRMHTLTLAGFIDGNKSFFEGFTLGYLKPIFSAAFLRSKNLRYDPDIRIGEDYMLLAEALACGALCAVEQQAGYLYTTRKNSISHRLTLKDIERIVAIDQKFTSRYRLDAESAAVQKKREASLNKVYGYTMMINALKQRDGAGLIKAVVKYPDAVKHLWKPVQVRLDRGKNLLRKVVKG